jgi:hypothetical protein
MQKVAQSMKYACVGYHARNHLIVQALKFSRVVMKSSIFLDKILLKEIRRFEVICHLNAWFMLVYYSAYLALPFNCEVWGGVFLRDCCPSIAFTAVHSCLHSNCHYNVGEPVTDFISLITHIKREIWIVFKNRAPRIIQVFVPNLLVVLGGLG